MYAHVGLLWLILQCLVGAVLCFDEPESEEDDGLHYQHQDDPSEKAGDAENRWRDIGVACQRQSWRWFFGQDFRILGVSVRTFAHLGVAVDKTPLLHGLSLSARDTGAVLLFTVEPSAAGDVRFRFSHKTSLAGLEALTFLCCRRRGAVHRQEEPQRHGSAQQGSDLESHLSW